MTKEYIINSKKYGKQIVLLDDEDYNDIIEKKYILHLKYDKTIKGFYIQFHYPDKTKKENRGTIGLHRYIMKCPNGLQVDHINRNTMDNRKENLRIVSPKDNAKNKGFYSNNKSGHKGVYFIKMFNSWIAEVRYDNKTYRSKRYKTMEEAIIARINLLYELKTEGVIA